MISIRDLAKEVGYSMATVSRALKDDPAIRASTREKIHAMADRLGYRPNALVQGITQGRSRLIAMISTGLAFESLSTQLAYTSDYLREQGYPLVALNSNNDPLQERTCFHMAVDHRVAGIILHGSVFDSSSKHFRQLIEANIPFVISNEYSPGIRVPHVYREDIDAIRQAVHEAVAQGHRRFSHLGGSAASLRSSARLKCYRQALKECGLSLPDNSVVATEWLAESGEAAALRLFEQDPHTTFLFTVTDEVAVGAYKACHKTGRRIPQDISILGCGNMRIGQVLTPPISTFDPKLKEISIATCELLFGMIRQHDFSYATSKPQFFSVPGAYLPGESTGPAPS